MTGKNKKKNQDDKADFRLPSQVAQFIQDLADLGIYGSRKSEVLRNIILEKMNEVAREDLVNKTIETRKLARREAKK